MIEHDLSHQLHSLATTVDERLDLAALHRRITAHNRRRAATKVGFAGVGVAAVVGGLFVVTNERSGPAQSGFASTPANSSGSSAASASTPAMEDPPALPDCATVLADLASEQSTAESVPAKDVPTDPSASADELGEHGFKGIVTITAIDGPQLSFAVDEPEIAPPSPGSGTLDEATEWVDGATPLTSPPALAVGDQLGLATRHDGDGVDRVIFIDVGPVSYEGKPDPVEKPTTDGAPLSDEELDKLADAATGNAGDNNAPDTGTALPGVSVVDDSIEKSTATITAADASTLTATLDDPSGQTQAITIDLAATPFYAGDALCAPGALAVGTKVGVAYHLDDAGTLVADSVLLMP